MQGKGTQPRLTGGRSAGWRGEGWGDSGRTQRDGAGGEGGSQGTKAEGKHTSWAGGEQGLSHAVTHYLAPGSPVRAWTPCHIFISPEMLFVLIFTCLKAGHLTVSGATQCNRSVSFSCLEIRKS